MPLNKKESSLMVAVILPFLVLVPCMVAHAADRLHSDCSVGAGVARELNRLDVEPPLPMDARRAFLEKLLLKYPEDFFVNARYVQLLRSGGKQKDAESLIEKYRGLATAHPNSLQYQYLYARALVDTDTPKAVDLLQKSIAKDSSYPWPYLGLAKIHETGTFLDVVQLRSRLGSFLQFCPNSLDSEAWQLMTRHATAEMAASNAERLRKILTDDKNPDHLQFWTTVWNLEFKGVPATDHEQLRKEIRDDVTRLEHDAAEPDAGRLMLLRKGYELLGDQAEATRVESELLQRHPQTVQANQVVRERWAKEHPVPKSNELEKLRAYYRAQVDITEKQVRMFPYLWRQWFDQLHALSKLEDATEEQITTAANGWLDALQMSGTDFFLPPPEIQVAEIYTRKRINLNQVPKLVEQGLRSYHEQRNHSDRFKNTGDSQEWFVTMSAAGVLVDAAKVMGRPQIAEDAVAELQAFSPTEPYYKFLPWSLRGKFAELEGRKLDALLMYRAAIQYRPADATPSDKDEISEAEQRLWKELGGSNASSDLFVKKADRLEITKQSDWTKPEKAMPSWELRDLQGHTWTLASLKGKVVVIDVWATWCVGCQQQLSDLQKLNDRVKDRSDIQIVTFNVDDEIGKVGPYIEERRYTFPVLLARDYVGDLWPLGIPRSWIISPQGDWLWEQDGYNSDPQWEEKIMQKLIAAKTSH
jgi:thiol-disulfide isomerase/thioredoxin